MSWLSPNSTAIILSNVTLSSNNHRSDTLGFGHGNLEENSLSNFWYLVRSAYAKQRTWARATDEPARYQRQKKWRWDRQTHRPFETIKIFLGSNKPAAGASHSNGWHSWPNLLLYITIMFLLRKGLQTFLWLKESLRPLIVKSIGFIHSEAAGKGWWEALVHRVGLYNKSSSGSPPETISSTIKRARGPARVVVSRPAWGSVDSLGPMIWEVSLGLSFGFTTCNQGTYNAVKPLDLFNIQSQKKCLFLAPVLLTCAIQM